nr:ABC transporter ATP-binding protein [Clostridia bacterium]
GGLDRYTSGDLIINGRSTKEYKDADWDTYRNHSIGFVFQSYNLIPHQSVLSNVELALTLSGVNKAERRAKAKAALEKVGLGDQLHKRPNQMSGGQMQRVAIARALVNDPEILLADEPTGALDTVTSVQVMDILKEVARDRLVIMVTHNRELAEEYSTRIVSLLDGKVTGDTDPYDDTKEVREKDTSREKKLKSMSLGTAMALSFNNLMSKRTRTLLTSFAGSIGIIGIALILAMSTGINAYIDGVQRDTLSSYPITLESKHADLSTMITAMGGGNGDSGGESTKHELDAVYSSAMLYKMLNSVFNTEINENNLTAFKSFLEAKMAEEGEESASNYISSVQYSYDVKLNTYVIGTEGKYVNTDMTDAFSSMADAAQMPSGEGMYGTMSESFTTFSLWDEMLPGQNGALVSDMLYEQYDLLHGKWPEAANEVVLILDRRNEITDLAFYALGMVEEEEIRDILAAVMKQEQIEFNTHKIDYADACNITFRLLTNSDYYRDDNGDGVYENIRNDEAMLDMVLRNAYELKIVGVIRPNEDAVATSLSGSFGYTTALTEYVISRTHDSEVYAAQNKPENENFDVFTGLPFVITEAIDPTDSFKADEIKTYFASITPEEKYEIYKAILADVPQSDIDSAVDAYMKEFDTRKKMEEMIASSYSAGS